MSTVSNMETVEVLIVNKQGVKTLMPDVATAQRYATKLWKGKVDRIEVKSVIKIIDAD